MIPFPVAADVESVNLDVHRDLAGIERELVAWFAATYATGPTRETEIVLVADAAPASMSRAGFRAWAFEADLPARVVRRVERIAAPRDHVIVVLAGEEGLRARAFDVRPFRIEPSSASALCFALASGARP